MTQTLPRMTADDILVTYHETMREYDAALDNEQPNANTLLAIATEIYADYDRALMNEFDMSPETNRYAFADRNADNAEGHAEPCERCGSPNGRCHCEICPTCGKLGHLGYHGVDHELMCPACAADAVHDRKPPFPWNARLAATAASIVTAAGGLALAIACLTGTPASAHVGGTHAYPVIGTPAYDASCTIVNEGDDFVRAYCTEDGETYLFDVDGQPYANAAGYPIRPPMSWYVAPELLQIGPNAPESAR